MRQILQLSSICFCFVWIFHRVLNTFVKMKRTSNRNERTKYTVNLVTLSGSGGGYWIWLPMSFTVSIVCTQNICIYGINTYIQMDVCEWVRIRSYTDMHAAQAKLPVFFLNWAWERTIFGLSFCFYWYFSQFFFCRFHHISHFTHFGCVSILLANFTQRAESPLKWIRREKHTKSVMKCYLICNISL